MTKNKQQRKITVLSPQGQKQATPLGAAYYITKIFLCKAFCQQLLLCMRYIGEFADFTVDGAQIAKVQVMQILVTGNAGVALELSE